MDDNELQISDEKSGQLKDTPMCIELGHTFGLAPAQIIKVLSSIIKVPKNDPPATPAELIIVLSVMQQYKMNPMLKQIHAWRDNRGELAVMMGYDGWTQKANEQPGFKYVSYEMGPECPSPDGHGKSAWEWVKATVHDSIRGDIVTFPIYLSEWYQPKGNYPGPWQKQTKHKMHIVAYRLAIREAYSIAMDIREPEDFQQPAATVADKTLDKLSAVGPEGKVEYRRYEKLPLSTEHMDAEADLLALDELADTAKELKEGAWEGSVPCGVAKCASNADVKCLSCGAMFCRSHTDNGTCGVCMLDMSEE